MHLSLLTIYISWEMTPTSIGGEKQACISGGVNPPADIASGRIAEVRSRSILRTAWDGDGNVVERTILVFESDP